MRNVTGFLSLAKMVHVAQVVLPLDVKDDIDELNVDINTAAETLWEKTNENSVKLRRIFDAVRLVLITVAAVMLLVSILGLILSILGHQHAIDIFIISGWLLLAVTFILCGVFVILDNAVSDTCMAMGEWVDHPQAETALSNILLCVDQRTTNQTLIRSLPLLLQPVGAFNATSLLSIRLLSAARSSVCTSRGFYGKCFSGLAELHLYSIRIWDLQQCWEVDTRNVWAVGSGNQHKLCS